MADCEEPSSVIWMAAAYLTTVGAFYLVGKSVSNPKAARDSILLTAILLLHQRNSIYQATIHPSAKSTLCYLTATLLAQITMVKWLHYQTYDYGISPESIRTLPLPPLVIPCRTTHARLFPEKHSFSYSYLLVGVSVDLAGASGAVIEVGGKYAWFSVHAQDYLTRGKTESGFSGKLKEYLTSQGRSVGNYDYAYLVTAPRFLGFSFNPVSFWYLYDHNGLLSSMILEVNNTFDERRMYLMDHKLKEDGVPSPLFSSAWAKDFHVSPFNDRGGSYSLTANDPATDPEGRIDNNIVLCDIDGKPKLVARVFSVDTGVDLSALPRFRRWAFITRWCWVGFMTNPRILREARILWIKKLRVYYRPEVLRTSIGRTETKSEGRTALLFKGFLTQLVSNCSQIVIINYTPAAGPNTGKTIKLSTCHLSASDDHATVLKIHVTTPAWYYEMIHCGSIELALSKYCFEAAADEAMLHVSNHELLRSLIQQYWSRSCDSRHTTDFPSVNERIVSKLRSHTRLASLSSKPAGFLCCYKHQTDLSDFDLYVKSNNSRHVYEDYLRMVRDAFLADHIAFGFAWLLSIYRFVLRSVCFGFLFWLSPSSPRFEYGTGTILSILPCVVIFHTFA